MSARADGGGRFSCALCATGRDNGRGRPACSGRVRASRTTVSNAFMSAVNNRELWMWDPWSGDNVAGEDDVELDGWNLVPARRSPYGTRVRQSEAPLGSTHDCVG